MLGMAALWCMPVTPEFWKLIRRITSLMTIDWTHCKYWTVKQDQESKDQRGKKSSKSSFEGKKSKE